MTPRSPLHRVDLDQRLCRNRSHLLEQLAQRKASEVEIRKFFAPLGHLGLGVGEELTGVLVGAQHQRSPLLLRALHGGLGSPIRHSRELTRLSANLLEVGLRSLPRLAEGGLGRMTCLVFDALRLASCTLEEVGSLGFCPTTQCCGGLGRAPQDVGSFATDELGSAVGVLERAVELVLDLECLGSRLVALEFALGSLATRLLQRIAQAGDLVAKF